MRWHCHRSLSLSTHLPLRRQRQLERVIVAVSDCAAPANSYTFHDSPMFRWVVAEEATSFPYFRLLSIAG
eukprot:2235493-Lingulodinium_polyedra.AAC.1